MYNRLQIVAMSDQQLVAALVAIAGVINSKPLTVSLTSHVAHQRQAQAAKAAAEIIRAEIILRQYKASIDGELLVERKPGWCWGDERPAINHTCKKGGGVWMPVK